MKSIIIAIDGPAGAGKSTLAKAIAKKLQIAYLDTGAMYRATAWYVLKNNISSKSELEICELLPTLNLHIEFNEAGQRIFVNNIDVTDEIRNNTISKAASDVSAIPAVRMAMVEIQRELAKKTSCVLDGRDIGSYVLPNADLKIFLTAGLEARAYRRWLEQKNKGGEASLTEVRQDIEYRDYQDSNRDFAPLKKAQDAIALDNTDISIERTVEMVIDLLKNSVGG